jgi:protocatechuate 3,4-dioxygenase beta subunit
MKRVAVLLVLLACGDLFAQGRGLGPAPQRLPAGRGQLPPRDAVGDQATGSAIIRGRIVAADTGTPIRRAQVRANAAEIRASRLASTDAEGRFELKDLPAGRWMLTASKAGFMTLRFGQRRAFEAGSPIDLSEGQMMDRANFALPRGAAVTGHVFDEYGDPVAGARVQVLRYQTVQGRRQLTPGAGDQTDDTGAFRVYGLAPGDYYVSAVLRVGGGGLGLGPVDDANDTTSYAATYYPGTGNVAEAQRITIGIGEEQSNINFALQPVRAVRISGTVVDSTGAPLSNGIITLINADTTGGFPGFGGNAGRVRPDGSFTIANVTPGSYTLIAATGLGGGFRRGGPGNDEVEFASVPVAVVNEDLTGVHVATSRGASITGTLVAAEGSIAKLNTTAIQVVAQSAQPLPGPLGARPTRVESDGTFVLANLNGQRYIRLNGLPQEWMLKTVTLDSTDVTDSPIEFRGSEQIAGLQITVTDKVSEVDGTVVTAKGEPTRDYTVVVFPDDPAKWAYPSRYLRSGRADQQGQFKIRGLPPDDRYLAVAVNYLEDGEGGDPQFLEQIKDSATRFSLREGETKALDLKLVER